MDPAARFSAAMSHISCTDMQCRSQCGRSTPSSDCNDCEEDIIEDIELLDLVNSAKHTATSSSKYPTGSALGTQQMVSTANTFAASAMASYFPAALTIEPISACGGSSSLKSAFEDLVRYLSTSTSKRSNPKKLATLTVDYSHGGDCSYRCRRNSMSINSATTRLQAWWREIRGRDTAMHQTPSITRSPTAMNGASYGPTNNILPAASDSSVDVNLMDDLHNGRLPSQRRNAMDLADPDEERRQFFTSYNTRMRPGGMVSVLNVFDDDHIFQSQATGFDRFQENVDYERPTLQRLAPCLHVEPQQCCSRSGHNRRNANMYHTSGPLISSGFTENLRRQAELSVKQQETIDALAVIANKARFVATSIDNTGAGGCAKIATEGAANNSSGSFSTIDLATAGVQYLRLSGTSPYPGHEPIGKKFLTKWKEVLERVFITAGK
ncbi:hypothetical protein V1520DRAFT_332077 [Lipomyces starkeyi]|uniref:Uncharacterized protein n=1 Tax=Lipomyces starkeyi NRRL Y-11557 TaxID=675824 RepID=A0A1E3Q2M7_LIPST|nr:hypothetical protein LIPSTDRAFT_112012 [Lipomyces starkeyi NRRL Y-11557]